MPEPATAPKFETGYVTPPLSAALTGWQVWNSTEQVPALQWPQRNVIFSRMGEEDGRCASMLHAIWLPIYRTPWRIAPNGARDEVVEFVANDLNLPIVGADDATVQKRRRKGRFSWTQHVKWALLALQYGHSMFEQVYRIEGSGSSARAHLHKLAPRPQRTITKINVALDGGLDSIVQAVPPGMSATNVSTIVDGGIKIPVEKLVAYVRDPEPGDWTGRSILRPAYKHWILKDELMRIQALAAKRNGIGIPVINGQEMASDDDLAKYQEMASAWQSSSANDGAALPYGAKAELAGVKGNLFDLVQPIEYHDKQIALAGLAHFLNLDRGGSYALASVQSDTFTQAEQSHAESIRDTAQEHVVEDLVDINFGEDEPAPQLVFDEIGSRQDLTAQALKLLIDAGLIRLDRSLEEYTRQQYGLPPKDTPAPDQPWTPPGQQQAPPPSGEGA